MFYKKIDEKMFLQARAANAGGGIGVRHRIHTPNVSANDLRLLTEPEVDTDRGDVAIRELVVSET